MDQKEYLQTVAEQIRCKMARDVVAEELANHIEDQKEAFLMEGMEEAEASIKAVEEMGDPVETGVTLDLIHRPKMEWKMIAFVIGLSVLGLCLQYVIGTSVESEVYRYNFYKQVRNVIVGVGIMLVFCFLDYSRIGLYGKVGAACLFLLSVSSNFYGVTVNGQSGYMKLIINFTIHQLIYLYIPFFGGILYSYKGQGKKAFYKSIAWMIAPVLAILPVSGSLVAVSLLVIMMIQLTVVVEKGWLQIRKKAWRVAMGAVVAIPIAYVFYFLVAGETEEYSELVQITRELIRGSTWIGQGNGVTIDALPFIESDFLIIYVVSTYGVFAAALLVGTLGFFVFWIVKISINQKNQLGMVMGIGCSLVFAVQMIAYLLVNVSLLPATAMYLPLFTYGRTGTFVSFALIGILLSIYRYQNVLPASPCKMEVTMKVEL